MSSGQKFIARNRAPRVQIEYDVELYGAQKTVQLPFVMGVMSDLAGKSDAAQPAVADRKFLEIDVDSFDDRMAALRPRAAFTVPNTLTKTGDLAVDLTFTSMADFAPAAIAARVEPLRVLLQARSELANLLTYMDGKAGAESLIERVLSDPALLGTLASATPAAETASALAALRAVDLAETPAPDTAAAALDALRRTPLTEAAESDPQAALDALRQATVAEAAEASPQSALDDLRSAAVAQDTPAEADPLAALRALDLAETPAPDTQAAALDALRQAPVTEVTEASTQSALDALRSMAVAQDTPDEADPLAALRALDLVETPAPDTQAAALDALRQAPVTEVPTADPQAALAALRQAPVAEVTEASPQSALDALRSAAVAQDTPAEADALAALRALDLAETPAPDTHAAALDALRQAPVTEVTEESPQSALDALRSTAVAQDTPDEADPLAALRQAPMAEAAEASPQSALNALRSTAVIQDTPAEADPLAALRVLDITETPAPDTQAAALDALRLAPMAEAAEEDVQAALAALRSAEVAGHADVDLAEAALEALRNVGLPNGVGADDAADSLAALRRSDLSEPPADDLAATLADLRASGREGLSEADGSAVDDALSGLRAGLADRSDDAPNPLSALDDLRATLPGAPSDLPAAFAEAVAEDDPLAGLDDIIAAPASEEEPLAGLDDLLTAPAEIAPDEDPLAGLGDLLSAPVEPAPKEDDLAGLGDLLGAPDEVALEDDPLAGLDDLLTAPAEPAAEDDPLAGLGDLVAEPLPGEDPLAGLDDLLTAPAEPAPEDDPLAGLDDLLAEPSPDEDPLAGLDDLLAAPSEPAAEEDPLAGLDDLLTAPAEPASEDDPLAGLDDLLAEPSPDEDPLAGLDDLLAAPSEPAAEEDPLAGLDDLLAPQTVGAAMDDRDMLSTSAAPVRDEFGALSLAAPDPAAMARRVFRIAVLADCSGRAAAGRVEIGDALASRRAIRLDIDRLDDIVSGFATKLRLPVGAAGEAIEVDLPDLDALHPDELFASVEVFAALKSLRQRLGGSTAEAAIREMQGWARDDASPLLPQRAKSSGGSVPADLRLDGFAALLGQQRGAGTSPVADILARAVAPHVVAAPHPEAGAYRAAVDAALSDAMRLVLHHPEFQQVESTWRTLDFLARRIETDAKVQITLYDISAEEFAADLAAVDDLSQSGLFRLLAENPLSESGEGGFSAIFGLYGFEETPPHAALLARMARIAAWADAPFVTGLAAGVLDLPLEERHPLVSAAWERLRAMPQAKWLGLALPRFMLRLPYGKKSDPIDSFAFEEFTLSEGLSGLLWGHPAAAIAVLLARTWTEGGRELGKVMSLGEMPFHYMTDRHGDQVALPSTERNLTLTKLESATRRGVMPLVSIRGRDQVRLASFQSYGGGPLMGPWAGAAGRPDISGPAPTLVTMMTTSEATAAETATAAADDDLDALLAGFADTGAAPAGDANDVDAELAALLEGL